MIVHQYQKDGRVGWHEIQDRRCDDVQKNGGTARLRPVACPALVFPSVANSRLLHFKVERMKSSQILPVVHVDGHVAQDGRIGINRMAIFEPTKAEPFRSIGFAGHDERVALAYLAVFHIQLDPL